VRSWGCDLGEHAARLKRRGALAARMTFVLSILSYLGRQRRLLARPDRWITKLRINPNGPRRDYCNGGSPPQLCPPSATAASVDIKLNFDYKQHYRFSKRLGHRGIVAREHWPCTNC
jgi:hypothetical protein